MRQAPGEKGTQVKKVNAGRPETSREIVRAKSRTGSGHGKSETMRAFESLGPHQLRERARRAGIRKALRAVEELVRIYAAMVSVEQNLSKRMRRDDNRVGADNAAVRIRALLAPPARKARKRKGKK